MAKKIFKFNLIELEEFSKKLSKKISLGNIILLKGELGSGKTTLTRFIIKNLFLINKLKQPKIIPSPTFSLLQEYNLRKFNICHYDFYRIKNLNEIYELGFEENIINNISIIEWPNKIINMVEKYHPIIIEIKIIDNNHRIVKILSEN